MTSTVGVPDLTGAIDTDVLIVGAGGRGLTLSLLLADYGATSPRPSTRAPTENMQQVRWCTSLGGDDAIDGQTSPTLRFRCP
jgi:hypothetical protein